MPIASKRAIIKSEPLNEFANQLIAETRMDFYDEYMKSRLDPTTTPQQKMDQFQGALKGILSVSKEDLKKAEAEDERIRRLSKGKPGPKPSSTSAHVSRNES